MKEQGHVWCDRIGKKWKREEEPGDDSREDKLTQAEEQRVQTNGRFLEKEFLFRQEETSITHRERKKNEKTEFIERQRDEESG